MALSRIRLLRVLKLPFVGLGVHQLCIGMGCRGVLALWRGMIRFNCLVASGSMEHLDCDLASIRLCYCANVEEPFSLNGNLKYAHSGPTCMSVILSARVLERELLPLMTRIL